MISILKPFKINQNNIKLISNFRLHRSITVYDLKTKVLFNKFKDWYTNVSTPSKAKHLKDILMKQQHLQKVQDERREISKLITEVQKLFIEKQDKIFLINRWENVQQYVNLRKEEAELINKVNELTAKFEVIDKNEKELFAVLNNTTKDSYERERTKIIKKYWGVIIPIVIVMFSGVLTIISTNVDETLLKIPDKKFGIVIEPNVVFIFVGVVLMFIFCGTCR